MDQARLDYADPGPGRPHRWTLRRIAALLVLLLVAYAGSYAVLLAPCELAEGGSHRMNVCRVPTYRAGGEFAHPVFRPAHWADLKLRPDYWAWHEEVWQQGEP